MSDNIGLVVHGADGVPLPGLAHPKSCACSGVQCSAFCFVVPHSSGRFSDEILFKTKEWSRYQFLSKSPSMKLDWPEFRDALLAKNADAPKVPAVPTGHQVLGIGPLSGRNAKAFRVVKP